MQMHTTGQQPNLVSCYLTFDSFSYVHATGSKSRTTCDRT